MIYSKKFSGFSIVEIIVSTASLTTLAFFIFQHFHKTHSFNTHILFENELNILRFRMIDNVSCGPTLNQCIQLKKIGFKFLENNINIYNIMGGKNLDKEGPDFDQWNVKAFCAEDNQYTWINISATRFNRHTQEAFKDAFTKRPLIFSSEEFLPKDLSLCKKKSDQLVFRCPDNQILRGINDAGIPICQEIKRTMFKKDNVEGWNCPEGQMLIGINRFDSNGKIIRNAECKSIPPAQPPCPDCGCAGGIVEWVEDPATTILYYQSLNGRPPHKGNDFCESKLGSGAIQGLNGAAMWVAKGVTWPTTAPSSSNCSQYNTTLNWWNPPVTAYYACIRPTPPIGFSTYDNVTHHYQTDSNGKTLKTCQCNGGPMPTGSTCL